MVARCRELARKLVRSRTNETNRVPQAVAVSSHFGAFRNGWLRNYWRPLSGKRSSARSARHIPGGLSANLTLPDCGRVARHPVIRQQLGASVELLASQPVNGKIWNDCFLPSRAIAALRTPPGLASGWGCRGRRLSRWRGNFGRRCGPCPCRLKGRRRVQVASAPARRWDR